ncbi:beta-ketoacyl reductase, partial [Streptomyces sp. KL109B]
MSQVLPSDGRIRLPYAWEGATLHASGASALRVSVSTVGDNAIRLRAADGAGMPVAEVASLAMLPADLTDLGSAAVTRGSLLRLEWTPAPTADAAPPTRLSLLGHDPFGLRAATADGVDWRRFTELSAATGDSSDVVVCIEGDETADVPEAARAALYRALDLVQAWVSDDRFGEARLVLVTRRAVVTESGEPVPDLSTAPLWGLLRSAQSEHPGRLVLADVDEDARSSAALPSALAGGATQFALRAGRVVVPRLARASSQHGPRGPESMPGGPESEGWSEPETPSPWDTDGTVLITGGTGTLGRLFARHLVTQHGVRHLLLVSRRGPDSPGAADLVAELSGLGGEVTIAACDVGDRGALSALLAAVPARRPLTGVVHAAGTLDDGLIAGMPPEKIDAVLTPKLDAAWNLHDVTKDLGLSAFVVFSSIMGTIGNAGQANYAAANVFLDALAQYRHATGLPATSLAWGFWSERSELTRGLNDADIARMARTGLKPLPSDEGVALFDAALTRGEATAAPVALDLDQLRAQAAGATLPEVLRGLVRARRAATTATATASTLADRLAGRTVEDVDHELLDLVRSHTATVLGHVGADSVQPAVAFRELGLDSLAAVELRKRLNEVTGLRMPATVVFDRPTPSALAAFLREELLGGSTQAVAPAAAAATAE